MEAGTKGGVRNGGAGPTRRDIRSTRVRSGLWVTPACTGEGWTTVDLGAVSIPNRVASPVFSRALPTGSWQARTTASAAIRTASVSTSAASARSRTSSTVTAARRNSIAWQ